MKKLYLTLIIGILLLGVLAIGVIAGGLLPKSDTTIKLDKSSECQTKFTIDNQEYTLHFKPTDTKNADVIKISRDTALKNNLEQSYFMEKIDAKSITSIDISSTICGGAETLGDGKVSLEIIR